MSCRCQEPGWFVGDPTIYLILNYLVTFWIILDYFKSFITP